MPTLLQINTVAGFSSTARIAEDIGGKAISMGWNSYIAYGRQKKTSESNLIKIGTEVDVKLHGIQTRLFDNHGLASTIPTKKFLKEIKRINPDIIHLHNIHGYYLNYKILFDYLSQIDTPVVWTLHDCWAYTGHCAHYTFSGCYKWKHICGDCPQKSIYPASICRDRSMGNFLDKKKSFTSVKNMIIVPVSNWLANEVKESFLNEYPINVIYNGVDTNIFSPLPNVKKELGLENKFVILGVSSVWNERKGFDDFKYLASFLADDEVIVLVGLSEKQIAELPPNIIGIQKTVDVIHLVKLYSSADLYVSFSIEETFGLTVVESLSCGTPALVYNSTACPEIISEETGFVVEPHNMEVVRTVIGKIKNNSKENYIKHCRKRAMKHFNKEERWSDYLKLYNDLIQW